MVAKSAIFTSFAEVTTLHGPSHILQATAIIEKVFWFIIMAFFALVAAYEVTAMLSDYYNDTLTTTVQTSATITDPSYFELTYCPSDWLDMDRVNKENTDKVTLLYALSYIPLADFRPIREIYSTLNASQKSEISIVECDRHDSDTSLHPYNQDYVLVFDSAKYSRIYLDSGLQSELENTGCSSVECFLTRLGRNLSVTGGTDGTNLTTSRYITSGRVCYEIDPGEVQGDMVVFSVTDAASAVTGSQLVLPGFSLSFSRLSGLFVPPPDSNLLYTTYDDPAAGGVKIDASPMTNLDTDEEYSFSVDVREMIQQSTRQRPCSVRSDNDDDDDDAEEEHHLLDAVKYNAQENCKARRVAHSVAAAAVAEDATLSRQYVECSAKNLSYLAEYVSGKEDAKSSTTANGTAPAVVWTQAEFVDGGAMQPNACTSMGSRFVGVMKSPSTYAECFHDNDTYIPPCHQVSYRLELVEKVDTTRVASVKTAGGVTSKADLVSKNAAVRTCSPQRPCSLRRTFRFRILSSVSYIQSRKMEWKDLMSNIGGTLGLFMGASLISLMHMLYFLVKSICARSGGNGDDDEKDDSGG